MGELENRDRWSEVFGLDSGSILTGNSSAILLWSSRCYAGKSCGDVCLEMEMELLDMVGVCTGCKHSSSIHSSIQSNQLQTRLDYLITLDFKCIASQLLLFSI